VKVIVSKTVLIVEDESIIANDLQYLVSEFGYAPVGRAATGEDAIDKALRLRPNIMLIDIRLRGPMTGMEAAESITKEIAVAIVFLSAFTPDPQFAKGCAFVPKPFSPQQLREGIEIALKTLPCHPAQP
jgi:CheY-like chemotaxis protein